MRLKKRMGKPGFLVGWESTSRQNKTRTTKSVVRKSPIGSIFVTSGKDM